MKRAAVALVILGAACGARSGLQIAAGGTGAGGASSSTTSSTIAGSGGQGGATTTTSGSTSSSAGTGGGPVLDACVAMKVEPPIDVPDPGGNDARRPSLVDIDTEPHTAGIVY